MSHIEPRQMISSPTKLLTFEFVGLCLVVCLAFCNVAVFYNLFNYLQTLGIRGELCGLIVGVYSLTAMLLFLVVSPFLSVVNAPRTMLLGIMVLILSGFSYFFVDSFWGLLSLRIFNGLGQFLLTAGTMSLFVSVIPLEKSGQAFSFYSIAILLPYGVVPTLMDALGAYIPTPPYGYALATISFIPAAWLILKIRKRTRCVRDLKTSPKRPSWQDIRTNLTQLPVALLLIMNLSYFVLWGSLFFLFKGFAAQQGLANVGSFFAVMTGLMIIIRLLAGRLFDILDKSRLMIISFALIGMGNFALDHLPGNWAIPLVALLFGLGMGAGYPAVNGLMFEVSAPRFRALNANLMLFTVHGGFFFGPAIGGALVARQGYHGYFLFSIGLALTTAVLSTLLIRSRRL
ncbi:MFS transporter [Geopsychrobacter electrodiphilus]|uniref:MFS transporter n=1 Tax=Geopsychrobacter electrodiphilus TaxID=225196 RepID=UPI0003703563|nr:MFS transporter [Geopsychrobacter electrodiphilus]